MWTKEESEKYAARRKPTIRLELSLEDRNYLIELLNYLAERSCVLSRKVVDFERNKKIITRLLNKKERVR